MQLSLLACRFRFNAVALTLLRLLLANHRIRQIFFVAINEFFSDCTYSYVYTTGKNWKYNENSHIEDGNLNKI